jgi:hypothetical protein
MSELPLPKIHMPANRIGAQPSVETAQSLVLDALSKGETDPVKVARMAGLKRAADVFIVLDKMALRKEFHIALAGAGLTLDKIAHRLGRIIDNEDDEVAIKGINTYMKSVGLEKYEETETAAKGWEEAVLEQATRTATLQPNGTYAVEAPEMPEEMRADKDKKKEEGKTLYE